MIDFRPDWQQDNPSILSTCRFVIPDKNKGYRSSFGARTTGFSSALNAACIGSRMFRSSGGTSYLFAGTTSKIYSMSAGSNADVTRTVGGAYAATKWWFEQFGDEFIACDIGTATQTSTGSNFAALTNAPKAKVMIAQRGHLLAMNYDDGSAVPNGIKWSSQNSSTTWTAATGNSAGNVTLRETPGKIIGGAAIHDVVVAWKRRSMYVGQRVGGADIWQFNLLSPYVGLIAPEAWVATPLGIIFVSDMGVFMFDGSVPRPIDQGIRETLTALIGTAGTESATVSHDEVAGCIFIWLPGIRTYCYNYFTERWSEAYSGTAIGGDGTWTGFEAAVRDANYDDYTNIGGSGNGSRRPHLIYSTEHKLTNLALFTGSTGIDPTFTIKTFRDPKAGPMDDTFLKRIIPIYGYEQVSGAFQEPTTATATVTARTRIAGGAQSAVSAAFGTHKAFDCNVAGNSMEITMTFAGAGIVVNDIAYETDFAGKK